LKLAASAAGEPGEPVPVAFCGRTSTLELQDPVASLRRQVRASQAALPPGWFIAAWYWDMESGGLDLEDRSQGDAYRRFADAEIPRDGGMADLLAEAASPMPRFAAVICEDIERSGRDTFTTSASKPRPSLDALHAAAPKAADPTLLDELPLAGDILPGLDPGLKPAGSTRSTCRCCGTSLASRPPSSPRSPRPPCRPCPRFSTPAKTGTMTPPTSPMVKRPMWRICSSPR
jgi:hypothetical protein